MDFTLVIQSTTRSIRDQDGLHPAVRGRYSGYIDTTRTMNVMGHPLRAVAALLLAALALAPPVARAHDRLAQHRTPAQEHSRFRWTNSCDSVPQKATTLVVVSTVDAPVQATVEPLRTRRHLPPSKRAHAVSSPIRSPHGLRAPPTDLA